ncbi:MAG: hypothetical protein HC930_08375 [Hydrococcus sp. SU_1_0]|nr:hypothetical protein [Hydrococcus sp. SU_1_0]
MSSHITTGGLFSPSHASGALWFFQAGDRWGDVSRRYAPLSLPTGNLSLCQCLGRIIPYRRTAHV